MATREDIEAAIKRRNTASDLRTEDDRQAQECIYALFDDTKRAGFTSGLLRLLMESTTTATAPYFWGYLMIKQIQRLLADIDPRLADPEVYFIFMQSYLFCDRRLVNLCSIAPRPAYQQHVLTFLRQSIAELVNAHPEHVRVAVDSICDYTKASVNYRFLDFAAAARSGEMFSWQDEALYKQYVDHIWTFVRSIDARLVTLEHPELGMFIRNVVSTRSRHLSFV